jgi:hypothetical protein
MVGWNKETKKRIQVVLSGAKTSFYYGFIPVIIYLGIRNIKVESHVRTCNVILVAQFKVV